MTMADWIQTGLLVCSIVALLFAGTQARDLRRERRANEDAARDGVAVQATCMVRPVDPREAASSGWKYELVAANPGRLPIYDVDVRWTFATPVQRLHWDKTLEEPTTVLVLKQPVILGGGRRSWSRTISLPFENRDALESSVTEIRFTDQKGVHHTNSMLGSAAGRRSSE